MGGDFEVDATRGRRWKALFLLMILCNLIMVVVGQLKYSFRVDFQHPQKVGTQSTFQYNLWVGTWELWKNDMKFLAALLFAFSGVWPYVKLLALAYIVASDRLSASKRGEMLRFLGILGKWSFLDICIVINVILAISFHFKILLIFEGWGQGVALDGAFMYTAAIIFSQAIGAMIPHHSLAQSDGVDLENPIPPSSGPPRFLPKLDQSRFRGECHVWILLVLIVATIATFCAGQYAKTVDIQYKYKILGQDVDIAGKSYSMLEGWMEIHNNVHLNLWNRTLAYFAFIFITLAPLAQNCLLFPAWYVLKRQPQNNRVLRRLRQRVAGFSFWAISDVNILGLGVMIMEIGNIGTHLAKDLSIIVHPREGMLLLAVAVLLEWLALWYMDAIQAAHTLEPFSDDETDPLVDKDEPDDRLVPS